jgi:hypothetical protein
VVELYGLRLSSCAGEILIVNEVAHAFGSADNHHTYPREIALSQEGYSVHGVWIEGEPIAVFSAQGGPTGVHPHSALILDDLVYLAVGNRVVCFLPAPFRVDWSTEVDWATCFGLHFSDTHDALISHGELAIARLSKGGEIVWTEGGRDIFTGGLTLEPTFVEVRDWDDQVHCFAYEDGALVKGSTPPPGGLAWLKSFLHRLTAQEP